jgi:hypothetical protein
MEQMIDSIRVQTIEGELRLLLIPSFMSSITWTDLTPVHGNMTFSVCDGEFTNENEMQLWYNQSIDTRANHMTQANHSVFARKLVVSLDEGKPLDLESGFDREFLTHRDKLSHPGLCAELVEMAKQPGNTIPE